MILIDFDRYDWPRAGLRGRYMVALSAVEKEGIPVDSDTFNRLHAKWDDIQLKLIEEYDVDYGCYVEGSFSEARFEKWLINKDIAWPRLESGRLDLDEDTFSDMSKCVPQVRKLSILRNTLAKFRLNNLTIGTDDRARCMIPPFSSRTGRNQLSSANYVFAYNKGLRSLIKPAEGEAVSYIDYSQQEVAIASLLIQAPLERVDEDIARMRAHMEQASRIVLTGFTVRTDVVIVKYPDR